MDLQLLVGSRFGDYDLAQLIGEGGMGCVFCGFHIHMKVDHAVKILRPDLAENREFLDRFFHEAHQGARLRHPNIVTIHYAGKSDTQPGGRRRVLTLPFLAMEFVQGQSLRRAARQQPGKVLSAHLAVMAALQTLDGLAYAHGSGMVHRDVKPDNLMVTPEGRIKIADFGLARDVDDGTGLTATGLVLGTPAYMSLEQWDGRTPLDGRTDLYSLGITLFQLLSGTNPYAGEAPVTIFRRLMVGEAPSLKLQAPHLDTDLCDIVDKLIAPKRDDRFDDALAAQAAFRKWIATHHIDTISATAELGRLSRRFDNPTSRTGTVQSDGPKPQTAAVPVGEALHRASRNAGTPPPDDPHARETATDGHAGRSPVSGRSSPSPLLDSPSSSSSRRRHSSSRVSPILDDPLPPSAPTSRRAPGTNLRPRTEKIDSLPFRAPILAGLMGLMLGAVGLIIWFTGPLPLPAAPPATDSPSRRGLVQAEGAVINVVRAADGTLIPEHVLRMPEYVRTAGLSGDLFAVGSPSMEGLMKQWAAGFQRHHPNVHVSVNSSDAPNAIRMLVLGTAHLAPMLRPMTAAEIAEFHHSFGSPPVAIPVAVDIPAVFVHRMNPLDSLSLEAFDAMYSSSRRMGVTADISVWGQLGLGDDWAKRPIELLGRPAVSGEHEFFRLVALRGGEFKATVREFHTPRDLLATLSDTPAGIGFGSLTAIGPDVKPLRLTRHNGGDAAAPSIENLLNGKYPLGRTVVVVVAKRPGDPLPVLLREFVRYMISQEGQTLVAKAGYWPIPPHDAEQLHHTLE